MALTPQQVTVLDSLLSDLADQRLDTDRRAELETMLRSDPEARDYYIRFMALCSDLHEATAVALSPDDERGDWANSPERPAGYLAHMGPIPFFAARGRSRWWAAWTATIATALAVATVAVVLWRPDRQATVATLDRGLFIGHLQGLAGIVELGGGRDSCAQVSDGQEVRSGQYLVTRGSDAQAAIRLQDGTLLMLSGDTELAIPREGTCRFRIDRGNLVADVQPRSADRALVICTAEANVQVLGTRLSVSRELKRTRVAVLEGEIRITRLSDQRELELDAMQATEVSAETDLRPAPIQGVTDHWSLDFNDGLPDGWQTGQLVFDRLPGGTQAAVQTSRVTEKGRQRYQIRSHNAWSDGLFSLHDDSRLHLRYRLEKPGTFLPYVVCRRHDFGQPVCTVLTPGNLRPTAAGQWLTMTLAMSQLHPTKTQDHVPLDGQLVAFLLVFDSPEQNPGLTIDRIWVTRGETAEP